MTTRISEQKNVKIRKPHRCNFCDRKFTQPTTMWNEVKVNEDGIYAIYICNTCRALTLNYPEIFLDQDENEYPMYCVAEHPDRKDRTPEEWLEDITGL